MLCLCRYSAMCYFHMLYSSERVIDLSLTLHNISGMGVTWCGISGKRLGKLPQNGSLDVPLTLLAITPGLQVSLADTSCMTVIVWCCAVLLVMCYISWSPLLTPVV